jgi:hypothetical protein
VLSAAVLVSHAGNLFAVRRQQWTCGKPCYTAELRLNSLPQILQDVKTVGDLPRMRRALVAALGK